MQLIGNVLFETLIVAHLLTNLRKFISLKFIQKTSGAKPLILLPFTSQAVSKNCLLDILISILSQTSLKKVTEWGARQQRKKFIGLETRKMTFRSPGFFWIRLGKRKTLGVKIPTENKDAFSSETSRCFQKHIKVLEGRKKKSCAYGTVVLLFLIIKEILPTNEIFNSVIQFTSIENYKIVMIILQYHQLHDKKKTYSYIITNLYYEYLQQT